MDTWVIVLIVIAVVVVLALVALTMSKRSGVAQTKKREQAREHLHAVELTGHHEVEQRDVGVRVARLRQRRTLLQQRHRTFDSTQMHRVKNRRVSEKVVDDVLVLAVLGPANRRRMKGIVAKLRIRAETLVPLNRPTT